MSFRVVALGSLLAALAACSGSSKVGQCNATNECPAGEVCQNKVCARTCDSTTPCPGGYSCQNGLCVTGSTGAPELSSVAGMSTEICDDGVPCIGAGFVVSGAHLANAIFTITGPDAAANSYEMTRVNATSDDNTAELTPVFPRRQVDLGEGTYVITAVNQSGTGNANVQLLRGEAGPALTADQLIDRINTASTGKKIQARFLDVVGGGGSGATGTLTSYENGGAPVDSQLQLREMRVVVNGGTTNAASVAINESKLEELCADANGCSINLGATRFHDQAVPSYVIAAPLNGGECRFYLDLANHSWTLSQDCVATYGVYAYNGTSGQYEFSRAYQRYEYSSAYGFDGSGATGTYTCGGTQGGDLDGQPLIVASFKGACYFAEAPADTAGAQTGCFTADNSAGFYLTASHPAWDYPGSYPKADVDADGDGDHDGTGAPAPRPWLAEDAQRQCVLTIKD